ncbi:hypothetical protein C8A00DRAFT_37696 [Chaetomidium leptoderma]|uniref:Uncharacterized protein n=1 Tax=Chaetomidium leptoderma TaxID=669021 RepID=A0AAN6VE90_9PEZI|nr:hypothetical protein C8A00DRAFT_37696 [Chaetomidium leptoderma]
MYQSCDIAQAEIVEKENSGLDQAIEQFWADYSPPSAEWTLVNLWDQSHILERSNSLLSVCFNFFTGNLFVNGYPLSKLPLDYQQHQTFCELFGEQILDVGPSTQLVVRAVPQTDQSDSAADDDSLEVWEYIPRGHLDKDLPNSFVNGYAHWLNLSTDEVEFRPISQKWMTNMDSSRRRTRAVSAKREDDL